MTGVPQEVIEKAIDGISENLAYDAKQRFGNVTVKRRARKGFIELYLSFPGYEYDFGWHLRKLDGHVDVGLDARTRGKWYEPMLGTPAKLDNLVETQWSALVNFCLGFVFGESMRAPKGFKSTKRKTIHTRKVKHTK